MQNFGQIWTPLIDLHEGNNVNKMSESSRCIICNYYDFLKLNFRFQPKACYGFHDLMKKAISFNNVAIVSVKVNYYKICLWYMGKNEGINIIKKNSDLKEKIRCL